LHTAIAKKFVTINVSSSSRAVKKYEIASFGVTSIGDNSSIDPTQDPATFAV